MWFFNVEFFSNNSKNSQCFGPISFEHNTFSCGSSQFSENVFGIDYILTYIRNLKKIVNLIFIFMDFRNWKKISWNWFFNTYILWKWTTYWPPPASPTLSINLVRSSSRTLIYWSRYSCKRWLVLGDSLTRPSTPSKISLSLICGDISAHGWL